MIRPTQKAFIQSTIKDEDTKYIHVSNASGNLVARIKFKNEAGDVKYVSATARIRNKASKGAILVALEEVQQKRNALNLEYIGTDLPAALAASKKTGATKLTLPPKADHDNQTGYPNVFINVLTRGWYVSRGFRAKVRTKHNTGEQFQKTFNCSQIRTENEAFILACKTADEWNGWPIKTDEEYLSFKKVIDWEEKIKVRKK